MVIDVLKINSKIHFHSLPSDSKESPLFQLVGVSDFGNLTLWIGISRKRVRPMLWKVASVYFTAPYIVHITCVTFFWNEVAHRHNLIKCLGVIEQRLVSNIGLQKILLSDNISRFLLIYKLCLLVSFFFFCILSYFSWIKNNNIISLENAICSTESLQEYRKCP